MSQLLPQVIIVVAFGAICFGCGYLTAFIVTRNQWRDEMITCVNLKTISTLKVCLICHSDRIKQAANLLAK
jgi:hypothetical protein